jgi:hypothetical protein
VRRPRLLDKLLLAGEILATYATVRRLLWRRTLPETVAALRMGAGDGESADGASRDDARHLASATVRTIRLLPTDSRCLVRSLVLIRVMARRGLGCTLVLSSPPPGPGFEAHAWIEHGGVPLLPPDAPGHEQLVRL